MCIAGFTVVTGEMRARALLWGDLTFHDATHTTNNVRLLAIFSFSIGQVGYKLSPVTVVTGNNHHELMGFGIWRSESNVDQLQQIRDLHALIPEWRAVWRTACGDGSS